MAAEAYQGQEGSQPESRGEPAGYVATTPNPCPLVAVAHGHTPTQDEAPVKQCPVMVKFERTSVRPLNRSSQAGCYDCLENLRGTSFGTSGQTWRSSHLRNEPFATLTSCDAPHLLHVDLMRTWCSMSFSGLFSKPLSLGMNAGNASADDNEAQSHI